MRSLRSIQPIMALCAILALTFFGTACKNRNIIDVVLTGPTPVVTPTLTPTIPTVPVVSSRPGDFNLFGTCVGTRTMLSWTLSDRAHGYFIERRIWTTGPWVRLSRLYSVSERINIEVDANTSAANYWRVVAINTMGETYSRSPEERDDKTATFACGPPAPPPPVAAPSPSAPAPAPPVSTPGPGSPAPAPAPSTPTPTPGGSCGGASASLPDVARGQTRGFAVSVPSGCPWTLTSNNHHVVSVNPASGTGSASGSVTALNSGTATICFVAGGVQVSCRTYNIP